MKIKKWFSILCVLIFLGKCSSAFAMTTADKESNYTAAVLQLETYLQSFGNSSAALAGTADTFKELEGYGQSLYFSYYVTVLQKIADENYDFLMGTYLDMMEANTEFNAYLQDVLKGSPIGAVDKLKVYAQGRECQHNGENEKAAEYFHECLSFCDASQRYMELIGDSYQTIYENALGLLNSGDFAGAYFQFASIPSYNDSKVIMASIVNQLGYTPESPDDTLTPVTNLEVKETHKDSMTLSWTVVSHAQTYEVYYQQSGSTEWVSAGNTDGTQITISPLTPGVSYNFKVVAASGKFKANEAIIQNQKIVTLAVGDYVTFGSYPQTEAGTDKTPIEWLVLEVQDNKALLISQNVLDWQAYNNFRENVWETCILRVWLNSVFLEKAFTTKEQDVIIETEVDNSKNQGYKGFTTIEGNSTKDHLFLLSYAELFKYLPNDSDKICNLTDYALKNGYIKSRNGYQDNGTGWWLRSSLSHNRGVAGSVSNRDGVYFSDVLYSFGIRPALWINLESEVFNSSVLHEEFGYK